MSTINNVRYVQCCLWEEDEQTEVYSVAEKYLGKAGRIFYFHRMVQHPTTIFNAGVFTSNGDKIWYGDIDIQNARKGLLHLSLKVGSLYVHSEISGKCRNNQLSTEEVKLSAAVMVEQGHILYSKKFKVNILILNNNLAGACGNRTHPARL
jgi:hypothetical protein